MKPQQKPKQCGLFTEQRGVLRGCVDRLLLFGLDDDVRNVLSTYNSQRVCRETNRKILRLYPLSTDSDVLNDVKLSTLYR
ncbi:hypothetical protein COOONC_19488 [Cooperia oncophora]